MRSRRESGSEQSGQVLVLFALTLVALLAALAVILDGGRVYAERRATQNAADAAAMAGATKLVKSNPAGSLSAVLAAACEAANKNGGFGSGSVDATCGTNGTDVMVHVPGGDLGTRLTNVLPVFENPGYVQVSVHMSFKSFMSGLLGLGDFETASIGVAVNIPGNGLGDALLVLDPVDCAALQLNGTNLLTVAGGNVQVDSSAEKSADTFCANKNAATKSGSGTGGMTNTGGANNIVGNGDPENISPAWTQSSYKPDPLTRVTVPPFDSTFASPAGTGTPNQPAPWNPPSGAVSASPGVYWGGITVQNNTTLTLAPGTYIMAGGGLNLQGNTATVTATGGVTFIYTRDPYCNSSLTSFPPGCNTPTQKSGDIDGGASSVGQSGGGFWGTAASALQPQVLDPDPYNLSNILIYVDRNVRSTTGNPCPAVTLDIGGGGYFNFATGSIIYGPCTFVRLHGTSDPASHGGAVVSWTVLIDGTKNLDLGGPSVGGEPFAQSNLVQ